MNKLQKFENKFERKYLHPKRTYKNQKITLYYTLVLIKFLIIEMHQVTNQMQRIRFQYVPNWCLSQQSETNERLFIIWAKKFNNILLYPFCQRNLQFLHAARITFDNINLSPRKKLISYHWWSWSSHSQLDWNEW